MYHQEFQKQKVKVEEHLIHLFGRFWIFSFFLFFLIVFSQFFFSSVLFNILFSFSFDNKIVDKSINKKKRKDFIKK